MNTAIVRVAPKETRQTMEGFGASGAWWAQAVGGWPEDVRAEIMKLLYSKTEGLGMTTYRYNLGGGSKESGKGNFPNPGRRASSFLREDGSYDWNRDAEAVWCLKEAVRHGADDVVFFVNSPPGRWTVSGTAQGKIPFQANLRRGCEADFTRYVLDVTEHFLADGIPVRSVSPINEPFGPWIEKAGQEGCHYHPAGVRRLLRRFAEEMGRRPGLQNVLLSGAENNDLRLMNKTYTRAVLNDPLIRTRLDGIDIHGYVFKPLEFLDDAGVRRRFRRYMARQYPDVPVRLTEWTHMRGGRDYGMDSALEQARTMAADLSALNVVSWQCWVAVSPEDFCDGLIYINQEARTFDIPKRYYAFGNFTKFIPRGAVRVDAGASDPRLTALAFRDGDRFVCVLINPAGETVPASLALEGAPLPRQAALHVTSDTQSLAAAEADPKAFSLPPRSVSTLVVG
ncbi:MAG: hypothetical protein LBJ11_07680 [Oscillospiraceae bacterium]|jgi:O-glycosyl hydrolase|nr:hypothetical protein [Oscillospiraceae bacterium]